MRSESPWTGFSQNSSPSRMKTGSTSSVWATNSAAQAVVERGGPTVSIRISSLPADRLRPRRLPDGFLAFGTGTGRAVGDGAPDRAHLGGREVGLVRGTAVGLYVRDHLRLRAARGPAAAARHLHQHPQQATLPGMAVRTALGGRVKRREDPRLVTGQGRYTDDIRPEHCLHAVFVRSTMAHARLSAVDVGAAREIPGVEAVYVAADLKFESETARPRMCTDEVSFVGDLIAVAVGSTREAAVDAAAAVVVDYEPLPVIVDPQKSDSVAFEFDLGDERALNGADVIVRGRFMNQRLAAAPIEGNAIVAEPDGNSGIRVWVSTQVPFGVRGVVAAALGLPEEKVRVIAGDVGGAFGAKLMTYPEQSVIAAVAMKLGRPVRWFEYRTENMVAMSQGRALVSDVALGATREGKLIGLEVNTVADAGAYAGLAPPQLVLTSMLLPSVYEIPNVRFAGRSMFTNTAVLSAYRGAGRPEAIAIMERAMDMLAAELKVDPAELRRRNLVAGPFPHTTPTGLNYDSGDYARALDLALQAAGYDDLRNDQRARRKRDERLQLGIGISSYVEMTAVLYTGEAATASAEADGSIVISTGTTASGQGHETVYSQLASQLLGVSMDSIRFVQSDTGLVKSGYGSSGSRS
ncbi:MAG: xanthine dehydrogenase family protein, partial [Chloroflexi bacterium]